MGNRRPWLTAALPTTDDGTGGGSTGGTGTATAAGGGGTGTAVATKKLEDVLREHPELVDELTQRTKAIADKEKSHGLRSGANALAKELGFEHSDQLAEVVRRYQEQQSATMTDAERAKAEAEKARQEAAALLEQAKVKEFRATAMLWLREAGAADLEVAAAALPTVGVTVDSDEEAIKAGVKALKDRTPGLFGGGQTGTPSAGGAGAPPAGGPGKNDGGAGEVGSQAKAQLERFQKRQRGRGPSGSR